MDDPRRPVSIAQSVQLRWVHGYEGLYAVSDHGHMVSYCRSEPLVLSRHFVPTGHVTALLHCGGKPSRRRVHRMVLEAFVGPAPEGMECCHNNGVPDDNRLENLRWDTRSENKIDDAHHGVLNTVKLTPEEVLEMRVAFQAGASRRTLSERYGVTVNHLNSVLRGDKWVRVGGPIAAKAFPRGETHPQSKLTEDDVREIRELRSDEGWTYAALADRFGVTVANIGCIVRRVTWSHVE